MNICPEKIVLIASIIALDIADGKSIDEINTYRNLFNAISCNLQTYCNQCVFIDKKKK